MTPQPHTIANVLYSESATTKLGRNLVLARIATGITQQELARLSGISRATIAQIESGISDPKISTIVDIAKAMGVSPLVLLVGDAELEALVRLTTDPQAPPALSLASAELVDRLEGLISTGLNRYRIRAAKLGVKAARASGLKSRAGLVGASIGSALRPGQGALCLTSWAVGLSQEPRSLPHSG